MTMTLGSTVILLIGIGLTLFWAGHSITRKTAHLNANIENSTITQLMSFNQATAVWAIAGIVAVVPLGILITQVLLK
jgi:hypothetical protein